MQGRSAGCRRLARWRLNSRAAAAAAAQAHAPPPPQQPKRTRRRSRRSPSARAAAAAAAAAHLRIASCSPAERADKMESISSMKMMAGWRSAAAANSARTSFSPSPTHLLVSEEAEMEKKVARLSAASALPSIVLPLPARREGARVRAV